MTGFGFLFGWYLNLLRKEMKEFIKSLMIAIVPVIISEGGQIYRQHKEHEYDRRKTEFEKRLNNAIEERENEL